MKRLYLIRHAKSSWDHPDLNDFDRPLNKRGMNDLPAAAERLKKRGFRPGKLFTSPALRARSTAEGLIEGCGLPRELLQERKELYLAGMEAWLDLIHSCPDADEEMAVCGHNPGITTFVEWLSDEAIGNLPTCGIACIQFNLPAWKDIGPASGDLIWFDFPKKHP
jgi:phosphohistidine phosphatase